jgi:hypothetical protein
MPCYAKPNGDIVWLEGGQMIFKCTCEHEYQDRKYGKGNRVWVPTMKGRRCTICETMVYDETSKETKQQRKKGGR